MKKGAGLLLALAERPKGEPMPDEPGDDDETYDTEAKTELAQKFYEAGATGDFEKAGMVLEKFVQLCTGM